MTKKKSPIKQNKNFLIILLSTILIFLFVFFIFSRNDKTKISEDKVVENINILSGMADDDGYIPEIYFLSVDSRKFNLYSTNSSWQIAKSKITNESFEYLVDRNSKNFTLDQYLNKYSKNILNISSPYNKSSISINGIEGYVLNDKKSIYYLMKGSLSNQVVIVKYEPQDQSEINIHDIINTMKYIN